MRCILHIGTEKTATTFIQNWLYANCEHLSSQGVALTTSSGKTNNRKLVSYFQNGIDDYLRNNGVHNDQERSIFFENFEKLFCDEISTLKRDHTTFLFTSEHFHSRLVSTCGIKNLKYFLDKFFDEYTIICYVREQSEVRTSLYSTSLKKNNGGGILEFQKNASPKDHYYNYLLSLGKWEEVFGKESLKLRIFSKDCLLDDDIRKDLLANVLPEIDSSKLYFRFDSINESLSQEESIIFQKINSNRPNFAGKYQDPTPFVIKSVIRNLDFLDTKTAIVDPRQGEMYDAFNDVNIQFFTRYFGKKENLFQKPTKVVGKADENKAFDINNISKLWGKIVSIKNLVVIRPHEIDFLLDLAIRLHSEGVISSRETITLLKLANRARPGGSKILSKIDEIRKGQK